MRFILLSLALLMLPVHAVTYVIGEDFDIFMSCTDPAYRQDGTELPTDEIAYVLWEIYTDDYVTYFTMWGGCTTTYYDINYLYPAAWNKRAKVVDTDGRSSDFAEGRSFKIVEEGACSG